MDEAHQSPVAFCPDCSCPSCQSIVRLGCRNCACDRCIRLHGSDDDYEFTSDDEEEAVTTLPQEVVDAARQKLMEARTDLHFNDDIDDYCLITLAHGESALLEMVHIAAGSTGCRSISAETMAKLEYSWGYEYGTCDWDSSDNLCSLGPNLYASFDRGYWALLPIDEEILEKLADPDTQFTPESPIQDIYNGKKSFKYIFAPFKTMGHLITRDVEATLDADIPDVNIHSSPYKNIPIIISHIQPHYAIYDLVSKATKQDGKIASTLRDRDGFKLRFLTHCEDIYNKWMNAELPPSFKATSTINGDNNENGCGSKEV